MNDTVLIADFETTTDINDCRVWAYGVCSVENPEFFEYGCNINEFMWFCANKKQNYKILFHNLKFDGQFIIAWLFENGYTHTTELVERREKTFNTLISDRGLFYQIEIIFSRKGKNINKVVFQDSYKLLPMSVREIAEVFKMPISKLHIDYEKPRPVGYEPTAEEIEYLRNDVTIVANGIKMYRDNDFNKMTIGSNALQDYKDIIGGQKTFDRLFPRTDFDADIRQSYKGGYTYLNPKYRGKNVKNGFVLDINGLYSYVMKEKKLPFGSPIYFNGQYEYDKMYPLYVQTIRCQFELKKGYIPTIQVRDDEHFKPTEYVSSSNYYTVVLTLTSVDLEMFFEHYEVYNLEYLSGWKFRGQTGLFDEYIDKWSTVKEEATKNKDYGMRLIAKLFLNSLSGKFGTIPRARSMVPYITKHGEVNYKRGEESERNSVYVIMSSYICAYGRQKIIQDIQKIQDDFNSGKSDVEFLYCDTDSIHCISRSGDFELPNLDIDFAKLGKYKIESKFKRGKYLRAKCYMLNRSDYDKDDYEIEVTVAGMPVECYEQVTFNNFKVGASYVGKLAPVIVPGGVILENIDFSIKDS